MRFNLHFESISPRFLNKILTLIGTELILISLFIIVLTPPASNYEFFIYQAYPLIFWLLLITVIIIGTIIMLINSLNYKKNGQWIFGFLIIILVDSILLFMPIIRGYLNFGSGDVLEHIGWMKDIINIGYVPHSNVYPLDHILGVVLYFFSGLSLQNITMIIPGLFSLFFIISFYLLSTVIFSKQSERLLLLIFASILIFGNGHMAFAPNPQAFMLLPFILYLIFKINNLNKNTIFSFPLIIITALLALFHPLISIIMISIFILFEIISCISKKMNLRGFYFKNITLPLLLSVVLFFSWSSYLYVLARTAKPIIESILGRGETVSEFQRYTIILGQVDIDVFSLIRLFLNIYGQQIILGTLSLICSIYIILKIIKNEKIPSIFSVSSLCFLMLFTGSILMFFINGAFGFGRIYSCCLIFSIILIPSTSLMITSNLKINPQVTGIIILILITGITWYSIFNLYYSPIIKETNLQVTKNEYNGMITFFQHRDDTFEIIEYGISQSRMYDAIFGFDYPSPNVRFYSASNQLMPPDHFNYTLKSTLGEIYKEKKYFLLTNQGKFYYQNIFPEFPEKWRFVPSDFQRLNYDSTVQYIYSNGNLEIRLIE